MAIVSVDNIIQEGEIRSILGLLQSRHDFDFSQYRLSSISRLISQRMEYLQLNSVMEYRSLLREDSEEAARLVSELTVDYSFFFRDKGALIDLQRLAIRPLLRQKYDHGDGLRAWCVGCAGGEEAYTLAMCFYEVSKGSFDEYRPVIFATDVDKDSLVNAYTACYSKRSVSELSPRYIERYFYYRDESYYVKDFIKKYLCIGKHNVLTDPPISRLDLISCRNLLIYFRREAQAKVLANIYYSLNPGGFLFLGRTEELVDEIKEKFEVVSPESRIFRKIV